MSRLGHITILSTAAIAASVVLPSGAAAWHSPEPHKCRENGTRVLVDPHDSQRPVSYTHDFAILFACEPYGVYVTYASEDGSRDQLSYSAGHAELRHEDAAREPTAAPPPAQPAEQRKARKRKARRACRKARGTTGRHARPRDRRAAERRERARRRAARRCKRRR